MADGLRAAPEQAAEMDWDAAARILANATQGADDGEIFMEDSRTESFYWDDGRLKSASFDATQGFGLRVVAGERAGYGHASVLETDAVSRAAEAAAAVKMGHQGTLDVSPAKVNRQLYADFDPIESPLFTDKTALLAEIDAYCRAKDPKVVQVAATLAGARRGLTILRPDGAKLTDHRPLVRVNVSVTVERDGRRESGSAGAGGREPYEVFISPERWKKLADEALRIALVNLDAIPAPTGEMDVVLGPGWPGVLLHEAVGHGLEGDFNRKGTSAFAGMVGERVAAPGVTVVDDGTIENRRGSLTIDDEGTPTQRTVLIEDGILKGYLQDRMNARLSGVAATGNGRRESYAHRPMPRMTNTFMTAGDKDPGEILTSLKSGIYAVNFGGGQVDITSGKFVFQCTEAYLVEDGKIKAPIKGATLIGDGPSALTRVTMVGNDLQLDEGVGTCGKAGQSVPVGVGQPTLYITGLTVGGG
ncbi:metalloprotease TldD [Terricaulis silvestris]|uniref:Protease TldD n=1 Tax=Terricaulis silvestris TaxID=2686094 RepID=A0A6I6MKL1_9CAUL|nr:metalloprotease TldD [Terricaulis silvestris]QGZ94521.1 protease TldD [Terricaulis silvestris]